MSDKLKSIQWLENRGVRHKVFELEREPKGVKDIAELYGCHVEQVIKTLLFVGEKNILVCLPGNKKVDIKKLSQVVGANISGLASSGEIKEITGYDWGEVCPFPPLTTVEVVLDSHCLQIETINFGTGRKTTGVEIASADLKQIWSGIIADITV